ITPSSSSPPMVRTGFGTIPTPMVLIAIFATFSPLVASVSRSAFPTFSPLWRSQVVRVRALVNAKYPLPSARRVLHKAAHERTIQSSDQIAPHWRHGVQRQLALGSA